MAASSLLGHTSMCCPISQTPSCTAQNIRPPFLLAFFSMNLRGRRDHIRRACTNMIPQSIQPTKSIWLPRKWLLGFFGANSDLHGLPHTTARRGYESPLNAHASQRAHCTLHTAPEWVGCHWPKESASARRRTRTRMPREQRSRFDLAAIGFASFHPSAVLLCDIVCLCACERAFAHACLGWFLLACLSPLLL